MKHNKFLLLVALVCAPVITRAVTVIGSLPYVITAPGAYVVESNLTGLNGIDVEASNVSIDLGGYTLTDAKSGTNFAMTVASGLSNVSVQNGTFSGFGWGVGFGGGGQGGGSGDKIRNVRILNIPNGGIGLNGVNDTLIENCFIVGVPGSNSPGITISSCSGVLLRNNQISEYGNGIASDVYCTGCVLTGNYEANCDIGLNLDPKTKYKGNVTTNCAHPIWGNPTPVGHENG